MEHTKFTPLGTRVIVREDTPEEKTTGGIIIPDTAKEKPTIGTVIYCGTDCRFVKPNDRVMYPKEGGTEMDINGERFLIILEEVIDGIL